MTQTVVLDDCSQIQTRQNNTLSHMSEVSAVSSQVEEAQLYSFQDISKGHLTKLGV